MKVQVPIEVILQDPSGPSPVPTPTPTPVPGTDTPCNCDCSTVSVPNTGMQTAADVTNNVSVGLVIVASLIFAVAIGTLMLYLFHLYNHQKAVENKEEEKIKKHESKKAKAHKWSRGLFIASGATAVLAFAAFIGSFIFYSMLQPKGTSATSEPSLASNESTYITTSDKITIVANRYDDVTIVANTVDSVFSTTDTTFGYKLFMSMSGEDNKLYLDGDNTSEYYFSPTTSAGLDGNSWGYNLNGSADYISTPLADVPILAKQTTSAVSEEATNFSYGIKANSNLPYGIYKGEIEYNIEGFSGFPSTLTYMQDMTTAICDTVYTPAAFKADGVTVEDVVPTATLKDNRDNKEYTIAKLADGKCWMTQNLDLQNEGLVQAIDSTNTDNPAAGFTLPDSQTSGSELWGYDETHLYDTPETTGSDGVTYTQKELGNLYNWYTATAGTGTYSIGAGEYATGSICPKGWRLPKQTYTGSIGYNGREYYAENVVIEDFGKLVKDYNVTNYREEGARLYWGASSGSEARMFESPLNLVRSGYYFNYGGGLKYVGNDGYLWSSRANNNANASYSSFRPTYVSPWNSTYKYNGYSVRCVAK